MVFLELYKEMFVHAEHMYNMFMNMDIGMNLSFALSFKKFLH